MEGLKKTLSDLGKYEEKVTILFTMFHIGKTDHMEDALMKKKVWKEKNNIKQDDRIIESLKMEKTSKIIESNISVIVIIRWLQPGKNLRAGENICAQRI